MNSCWWYQKRWRPIRVGGLMCNAVLPNLPLPKSSVMCCGLYSGSVLATSPNISLGFSPQIWQCNRTDVWMVVRTSKRYLLLGMEDRSSMCLRQATEDPCFIWEEKERWVSAAFPFLWGLDRGSGVHCCCTRLEMLPPLALSWWPVGLKAVSAESPCDWLVGPRA